MPRCRGDPLEYEFKDGQWLDGAHRAEPFSGMAADPLVHFGNLVVRQAGISLRNRHELSLIPHAECVIGQQAGATPAAWLRVDQHRIDCVSVSYTHLRAHETPE